MSEAADVKPDVKPAADGAEGNTITIRVRDQVCYADLGCGSWVCNGSLVLSTSICSCGVFLTLQIIFACVYRLARRHSSKSNAAHEWRRCLVDIDATLPLCLYQ